jgi:hypothetical protein
VYSLSLDTAATALASTTLTVVVLEQVTVPLVAATQVASAAPGAAKTPKVAAPAIRRLRALNRA